MLFDFQWFINDLRQNPEKKTIIEKYENLIWPIQWDLKDQIWYKEYINTFKPISYKVPEDIKEDFDWDLLIQLISASFSSEWTIDVQSDPYDLIVTVQSWEQVVIKKISELWWFQILRLFEIYSEEQLNLHLLMVEDEKEKESILSQRESRIHRWSIVLENLENQIELKKDEIEKEDKLKNLMDQL